MGYNHRNADSRTALYLSIYIHGFIVIQSKRRCIAETVSDKMCIRDSFRGREVSHSQIGYTLLERFAEQAKEAGTVEKPAKLEGRNMTMFLAPLS